MAEIKVIQDAKLTLFNGIPTFHVYYDGEYKETFVLADKSDPKPDELLKEIAYLNQKVSRLEDIEYKKNVVLQEIKAIAEDVKVYDPLAKKILDLITKAEEE